MSTKGTPAASMRLGRRPPVHRRTLSVNQFFTAIPDRPLVDPPPGLAYDMCHNQEAGCCVVAACEHTLQTMAAAFGTPRPSWTDAQQLAFYRTQNPGFRDYKRDGGGPDDNGMVIQTFLEHLVSVGEILAFGSIDLTEDRLKAAIYIGLAVVTGENLTVAQQDLTRWDYVEADPWGGHATCSVGFNPDEQSVVTWGQVVPATDRFITRQVEEAWFLLTEDMVAHPGFRNHFDLNGFAEAVAGLTGGKVVVPVPPPGPVNPPTPTPAPDPLDGFPFTEIDAWAARPHVFRRATAAARAYRAWRAAHPDVD